jgi:hypothetical protein
MEIIIKPRNLLQEIQSHLFPEYNEVEQALFLFAHYNKKENNLTVIDHLFLYSDDFNIQSAWHIELKDEIRSKVIKKAHDLNTSVIEIHSHIDQETAKFSESDWYGFQEFVPHILWRLKNRPYTALVFGPNNFDAITWSDNVENPQMISAVRTGDTFLYPTHKSLKSYDY